MIIIFFCGVFNKTITQVQYITQTSGQASHLTKTLRKGLAMVIFAVLKSPNNDCLVLNL